MSPYVKLSQQDFSATLAEIKRRSEQDRIERQLRQAEAAGRALCEQAERERKARREPEYAI